MGDYFNREVQAHIIVLAFNNSPVMELHLTCEPVPHFTNSSWLCAPHGIAEKLRCC